jgi:hypothetical protein
MVESLEPVKGIVASVSVSYVDDNVDISHRNDSIHCRLEMVDLVLPCTE